MARYLPRAFAAPGDIEARCGMAQASLTAGLAVRLTDVAGVHCLAEAIGGLYGHPHGYCCAACMPPVMDYNLPVSRDKYARLAIDFIRQLNNDLDVPPLSKLLRAPDLDLLGEKAQQNTSAPSNPRAANAAAFTAMFANELNRAR